MRRRVCGTARFLDLGAAIELGLPPFTRPGESAIAVLLSEGNLRARSFPRPSSEVQANPTLMTLSQTGSNWSDSSCQTRLAKSYLVASRVLPIVNSEIRKRLTDSRTMR